MILSNLTTSLNNTRFAAVNKSLEAKKKKISNKYLGMYGIHSVGASNPDQSIKVFFHDGSDVDSKVKKDIKTMAGKFSVEFKESPVKNPEDYHLEESFEKD